MRSLLIRTRLLIMASALGLCLMSGCSKGPNKKVHPVRGQVLLEGKGVPEAIVTFHPVGVDPETAPSREPAPSARTDDEGNFVLTSYANGDGAPEGEYSVTVTWFRSYKTGQGEDDVTTANCLPPRYANPGSSGLKATVAKGENNLPAIHVLPR